jgi:hypothetical protein
MNSNQWDLENQPCPVNTISHLVLSRSFFSNGNLSHARGAMPLSIVTLSNECCYAECRIFILSVAIVAKNQLASLFFISHLRYNIQLTSVNTRQSLCNWVLNEGGHN